jgi:hypothetical protein
VPDEREGEVLEGEDKRLSERGKEEFWREARGFLVC